MPFALFDHTGDVGLELHAPTLDELFEAAAAGFVETVAEAAAVRADDAFTVELAAESPDLLLLDWLSELLFRFDTEGFLPARVSVHLAREGEWRLRAEVLGERAAASRLPIKVLVKAVTYHALEIRPTADGWMGRVVLDI